MSVLLRREEIFSISDFEFRNIFLKLSDLIFKSTLYGFQRRECFKIIP